MSKKSKKAKRNKQIGTLTDKQKYEAKLQEKDARIKELELELIIAVIHSDQGSQYQSPTYQARLEEMELLQSMSRKGNCHDNAPGETIFNLMKRERLNRVKLHSLEEVQQELTDYIYWFNNIRRSNKLNYTTPVKYRDRVMATI